MGARLRRIGEEAAKFSAVNVVATAVALVIFNLLVHGIPGIYTPGPLNGWPLTSWFLANCVGMAISFYGSRSFAFKHRKPSGPGGGALIYVVINLVSFVIPMACLWITRNVHRLGLRARRQRLGQPGRCVPRDAVPVLGLPPVRLQARRRGDLRTSRASTCSAGAPELRPDEAELLEHQTQQRKADPHDVVRVARHAGDEGATEPVEGEGPGHR